MNVTAHLPDFSLKVEIAKSLLDLAKADYDDVYKTWSSLETKAQGAITVAGIFLAALYGLARDNRVLTIPGVSIVIAAAIVVLLAAVITALLALRVRQVPRPPSTEYDEMAKYMYGLEDPIELQMRFPDFIGSQAESWKNVIRELAEANNNKAGHLFRAQILLVCAVILVAVATLYLLLF